MFSTPDFLHRLSSREGRTGARLAAAAALGLALLVASLPPPAAAQSQTQPAPQPAPQASPQGQATQAKVFGDWVQRCTPNPPPGASPPRDGELEACFIAHQYVDPGSRRPLLKITIGFFEPGRRPGAVIAMPLGVPLASGIRLSVDGKEVAALPFQVCRRDGCQAFLPLSDEVVAAFKAGTKAHARVASSQGEGLDLPFSLKGFTAGYGSIQ